MLEKRMTRWLGSNMGGGRAMLCGGNVWKLEVMPKRTRPGHFLLEGKNGPRWEIFRKAC